MHEKSCLSCDKPLSALRNKAKKFCGPHCKNEYNALRKFLNAIGRHGLTIAEAARDMSLAESTVRNRIRKHGIETFRLKRCVRIRRGDVRLLK